MSCEEDKPGKETQGNVRRRKVRIWVGIDKGDNGAALPALIYMSDSRTFWKHEPPKPTDAFRNLLPMRESMPMATATSLTSAPVFSHSAEIELIDEMRCARKALATSLDSCGHCESDKCREVKGLVVRRKFCQHKRDNTMKLRMVLEASFASIALGWIGARDWTRLSEHTHCARAYLGRPQVGGQDALLRHKVLVHPHE